MRSPALTSSPASRRLSRRDAGRLALGVFALALAAWVSIGVGGANMSLLDVVTGRASADDLLVFTLSRVPRTLAIILAGASMSVAGLVMQMLVRNRFVEPSTTGVTESATLGILVVTIVAPALPLPVKMIVACCFALAGTGLLLGLVRLLPHRDVIVVPLLGILLSGIIGAAGTLLAWQYQLQGTVAAWSLGDFSGIIAGRYELLWIVGGCAIAAYLLADGLTMIGLGEDVARNLGVSVATISGVGLAIVAVIAGVVTVVAGSLPFLGLVVPNLVSLLVGDFVRRSLPLVALGGALFVLLSDVIARSVIAPAEIPVGTVMGVIGGTFFLVFLLRQGRRQ